MDGDSSARARPHRLVRILLLVLGVVTLACGATAVFLSTNDTGAAALVIAGAALLALGVLIERIAWVKAGPVELQLLELARIQAETAAAAEAGDRERAMRLSDQAASVVATVSPLAAELQRSRVARASGGATERPMRPPSAPTA